MSILTAFSRILTRKTTPESNYLKDSGGEERNIALVGDAGSGKSSFVNAVLRYVYVSMLFTYSFMFHFQL